MCTIAMLLWALFHPAGERVFLTPSSAMAPTIILGDRIVMVPYPSGAGPRRGDIIAFVAAGDFRTVNVFRVVGLAGDTVQMAAGAVVLNGIPLEREPAGGYDIDFGFETVPAALWRETLPDGRSYLTADAEANGFLDETAMFRVPEGHYFVLGDNRDNAADSRLADRVGFVSAATVLGRADHILATCRDDGLFIADRAGLSLVPGG